MHNIAIEYVSCQVCGKVMMLAAGLKLVTFTAELFICWFYCERDSIFILIKNSACDKGVCLG